MSGDRAIVTGGAGFIGSALVDALVDRGVEVTVIDDLSTGSRENLASALDRGVELVEQDIRAALAVRETFARVKPTVTYHLAAQMDVRKSVANPMSDAMTNVLGTISVLAAANLSGCARMVNASTGGAIYGEGGGRAAVESDPLLPEAPYGQSKHSAEGYCDLYNRMYDLSTVSLRFGNVYGPRQNPAGEAGVIAIFCGLILDGAPITVFGDGKQTRDYVYVDDVVAGAIAAADSEAVGAFNLGTGRPTSILDLIDGLEAVIRSEVDYLSAPHRPGELEHIHLDTERTAQTLGWRSEVDLSDGLRQTLDWFRSAANAHADYKV